MGNLALAGSASPSIFVMTKTKKFYFISTKRKEPISFNSSSKENYFGMNDKTLSNYSRTINYEERKVSSTCIREEHFKNDAQRILEAAVETENISIVLTASTFLHGLDYKCQRLPLGTILKALFQYENWLYVRTAHGQEGYVARDICLPLEAPFAPLHATESDFEYEPLKLIYEADFSNSINYSERNVDTLYLQANGIRRRKQNQLKFKDEEKKSIELIIKNDFTSAQECTMSVKKGEVVFLLHNRVTGWFWVENKHCLRGFIPAAIAGYIKS